MIIIPRNFSLPSQLFRYENFLFSLCSCKEQRDDIFFNILFLLYIYENMGNDEFFFHNLS